MEADDGIYAAWLEEYVGDNHLCYNMEVGETVRKDCPRGDFHFLATRQPEKTVLLICHVFPSTESVMRAPPQPDLLIQNLGECAIKLLLIGPFHRHRAGERVAVAGYAALRVPGRGCDAALQRDGAAVRAGFPRNGTAALEP